MSDATSPSPPRSLGALIASIEDAATPPEITVGEILDALGHRSFAPAVLLPALVLVSPVSGIPGVPTVGAVIIVLVTLQWLLRRDHLWLPGWILDRSLRSERLRSGLEKLEKFAHWLDDHSARRLSVLARPPLGALVLLSIMAMAATWPFLELLPMVTSIGATAVCLLALGVWVRDGLFVVAGYFVGAALYLSVFQLAGAVLG